MCTCVFLSVNCVHVHCELVCLSISKDRQMCHVYAHECVHVHEGPCVCVYARVRV